MMIIISPSKTMIDNVNNLRLESTVPKFQSEIKELVEILQSLRTPDIMTLMSVSEKIGIQTYERYCDFNTDFSGDKSAVAINSFTGEVYNGLFASDLNAPDLKYAQKTLRILSGLYGCLKPLDRFRPYRLEMDTKLKTSAGNNLYTYWRDKLTRHINNETSANDCLYLANLASSEYSKALHLNKIEVPVISFEFLEIKNGKPSFVSFSAKRARGLMAAYIIKNRIRFPDRLVQFNSENYTYDATSSSETSLTFIKH
jgi:cytoplasmic iron level regulating protein YaaA (DUF328/UPF0246 family)